MRLWKVAVIRALAIANAFFVISGLYFLVGALRRNYEFGRLIPAEPYYAQVFYARSLLNLGFLIGLAVASVAIWGLKPSGRRLCNAVFVGEILYFVSTLAFTMAIWSCGGSLGLLGQALAGSAGTGNMGIALQSVTGYPIIALVILNLAFPESANGSVGSGGSTSKWHSLAHRAGVLLGVILGIVYFGDAAFMLVRGGAKSWLEIIFWLLAALAFLSFLPLSILGIFRPRAAAYGIVAAFVLLQATGWGGVAFGFGKADWSLHSMAHMFLLEILLPCAVVALLFHASAPVAPLGASMTGARESS
jgi:hypothetical protein